MHQQHSFIKQYGSFRLPAEEGSEVFVICAQIEQEIAELDDDEKAMFLEDLGLKQSGLEKLIKASYSLLGLHKSPVLQSADCKKQTIPDHLLHRLPQRFLPADRPLDVL